MPRRPRKPRLITLPSFRVGILEHVEVDGTRYVRDVTLFEGDVPASSQTITQLTPPMSATTTLTCTLSAAQGRAYTQALMPRYTACEECAWFFHLGPEHGTMCIGYLTEWAVQHETDDRLTYILTFVDSGRREFPVRHVVTTPAPTVSP